jgi:formamidopyrimidine-DNA glycosylase
MHPPRRAGRRPRLPELPEVETLRRDLAAAVAGRTIEEVRRTGLKGPRVPSEPAAFDQGLRGGLVTGVGRRGKLLLVELVGSGGGPAPTSGVPTGGVPTGGVPTGGVRGTSTRAAVLAIHLGMSGQLLLEAVPRPGVVGAPGSRPAHTQLELVFTDGAVLRFVDPRRFGWFALAPADEADAALPLLGRLGVEPLDPAFSAADLARLLAGRGARLKSWLLDQRRLAGIGNIYSDEILFAARLRFDRTGAGLTSREVRRLHGSIRAVLEAAIAARGSSLADAQYRDLGGRPGTFQLQHAVYGRAGAPCTRCGRPIIRAVVGGRSSFFCPRCQR